MPSDKERLDWMAAHAVELDKSKGGEWLCYRKGWASGVWKKTIRKAIDAAMKDWKRR